MSDYSRRDVIRLAAASATTAGVLTVGSAASDRQAESEWVVAESPTEEPLNDAVDTAAGPFAVGASGNVVARRESGWQKVVEYGPQARSRRLTGIDVTDGGRAVWFVGGSGVIGEYDVETQTLTNYSAPGGKTSTWEDCAVQGTAGKDERLYFVNGSGELLVGARRDSGALEYADVVKPGGGSTIPGIDFNAREAGHVCSTSQFVAETGDGGETWDRIGIDFAGGAFFDVASQGGSDVNVAGGSGIIYRYDGFRWTPHVVDDGRQAIRAIDRDGDEGLAAGDGGKVYERQSAGQWTRHETSVDAKLEGAARGATYDVAVGDGGTILERTVGDSSTDGDGNSTDSDSNSTASGVANDSTNALSDEPLSVATYLEGDWVVSFRD
ncbi:hypothetical protein [Halomontanus rarus]|uniref:hypothetical protein n=1 Tax=Halomontanus rarus TaxID=3034020 RepID=UPI0023E7754B|nr:hypothetical protein [Halovivax sp. TS33]